jgi:hypothetical protein
MKKCKRKVRESEKNVCKFSFKTEKARAILEVAKNGLLLLQNILCSHFSSLNCKKLAKIATFARTNLTQPFN